MSGRKSRDKGKRGELEIVHMLRDELGITCNRNYKQMAQAQHGDIEQLIGGYLLEVKNCASLDKMKQWWKQAEKAASAHPESPKPCLVYKLGARRGWRFRIPLPEAWASGHQWRTDFQYTVDLSPEGFFLIVRERLG